MTARWGASLLVLLTALVAPMMASAQESRPTVQQRFGAKTNHIYGHVTAMTQIRNDYYDSFGLGADAGYYFSESFGLEFRGLWVRSTLGPAAEVVKSETGLTPDARPQQSMWTAGVRYSFGYGKMLVAKNFVVHFDPQVAVHGGFAVAEKRVLPTATFALSLLTHFQHGIQAKIDLGAAVQVEDRNRGWVPSIGFVPTIGVGGTIGVKELTEALQFRNGGD